MKKSLVIAWLVVLSCIIGVLFWRNEFIYSLPTPVPETYLPVASGTVVNVAAQLKLGNSKPLFLHFFNPECPCSKFNITHFKSLVKQYGNNVTFAMVVMSNDKQLKVKDIQDKYNLNIPVFFNTSIAATCGVYSTPQAAIIDTNNKLYYRGNYNKSRYCTDKKSNYAQIALEAMLAHQYQPSFDRFALTSYGCQLPKCNK